MAGNAQSQEMIRLIRRQVRRRLIFFRQLVYFVLICGLLALLDWRAGGEWWVQWLALGWGGLIAVRYAPLAVLALSILALINWVIGGMWWVQWVVVLWGGFLAMRFVSQFLAPSLWGPDAEERLLQGELRRRGHPSR